MEYRNALPEGTLLVERYRILKVIGGGGFGLVYLGIHEDLKRPVVIKEYLPNELALRLDGSTVAAQTSKDEETYRWGLERFIDEARILTTFDHPNIVEVRDFFRTNNTAYMVMRHEAKQSLAEYLERHPTLTLAQIEALILPLLDALAVIHRAGFLHRDLKPGNILIRPDDSPVLIDFGSTRQQVANRSRSMTSVVTAGYAPFEQYQSRGTEQGPWTDLYAIGGILYRCVTGEVPPEASGRIRNDPMLPAVKAAAGHYPHALLQAIDWALAVFPEERPQDIAAFLARLHGEEKPEASSPTTTTRQLPPEPNPVANDVGLQSQSGLNATTVQAWKKAIRWGASHRHGRDYGNWNCPARQPTSVQSFAIHTMGR